jgi:hypothetical protein
MSYSCPCNGDFLSDGCLCGSKILSYGCLSSTSVGSFGSHSLDDCTLLGDCRDASGQDRN